VIFEDENLIAVDKPSSMPVHPCGNFKYNSLISILELEKGYKNLKIVHRLDR
jgi:23S rRNA-/tRNA-specific pseudouridylate synthase